MQLLLYTRVQPSGLFKVFVSLSRPRRFSCALLVLSLVLVCQPGARGQPVEGQPAQETREEQDQSLLAGALTAINIPARGIVCGLTGVLAGIFMAASGGTRSAEAAQMVREGCSGPWVITPEMIDGTRPPQTPAN